MRPSYCSDRPVSNHFHRYLSGQIPLPIAKQSVYHDTIMAKIIISANLPGPAIAQLASTHEVIIGPHPHGLGTEGLTESLQKNPDTTAIISLLSDGISRELLNNAPELRIVANYAVGVDNINLAECRARQIMVTNTPGVLTEATADLAMALMLDACRNVSRGDRLTREGKWKGWSATFLVGPRVTGATLGIVGFGRIGQAVAKRAAGFDMKVLYTQRHRADFSIENELKATYVSLDDLLSASDIVSLHCPLTETTRGMFSKERMLRMRVGSVLVNCARGACVDEEALAQLLACEHIAAAGLDVYKQEPQVNEMLLSLPNVVLAPHLGSADIPTRERMAQMCVDSVVAALEGRDPPNRVA